MTTASYLEQNRYIFLDSNSTSAKVFGKFIYGRFDVPRQNNGTFSLNFLPAKDSIHNMSLTSTKLELLQKCGIPITDIDLDASFPFLSGE